MDEKPYGYPVLTHFNHISLAASRGEWYIFANFAVRLRRIIAFSHFLEVNKMHKKRLPM